MAAHEWTYPATVIKVIDGDTIRLDLDLGLHIHRTENVRVRHINAPEIDTPAGKAARRYAEQLLPPGAQLFVVSRSLDKYGRPLADLRLPGGDDYATALLAAGQATRYVSSIQLVLGPAPKPSGGPGRWFQHEVQDAGSADGGEGQRAGA